MICVTENGVTAIVQQDGKVFEVGPDDEERTVFFNNWGVHIFKRQRARPPRLDAKTCGESLVYG